MTKQKPNSKSVDILFCTKGKNPIYTGFSPVVLPSSSTLGWNIK